MPRLTLLILVDAFRPDYLRDAPRLRRLAGEAETGRLREPFGFVPRAAYFGGLSPEALGYSNMFRQADGDTPFAAAAGLPPAAIDALGPPMPVRAFLDRRARAAVSPYAQYVSSMRVPAAVLPHLAPVETRPPWDPRVGYRSLFHELDAAGMRWLSAAWPDTTSLADPSDSGILADVRARLEPSHRFAFVHFQELDAAGHYHGPESAALRAHVGRIDALVGTLVDAACARFDAVDVVAFGDHGMVTVTRTVDVRPALAATGLVPGVDYLYFLDSTMVRLWYLTSRARERLHDAVAGVDGLTYVDAAAARHHRVAGCDPKNAHAIFLARPGVIVWPDFFASNATRPKGMHGYDPDCVDNQGIYLHWRSDGPRVQRDAGTVDATDLHGRLRGLTGLAPRPAPAPRAGAEPRFTSCPDPTAEIRVAADMERVVDEVRRVSPGAEAIVLTGSFGRGEGAVLSGADGCSPLNDYDILVVGGTDRQVALSELADRLKPAFGLDYLDIVWSADDLAGRPLTIANFDLKFGSRVLWGSPEILDRLPPYAAADLQLQEALTLLLNRAAGLLSGLGQGSASPGPSAAAGPYLDTQVVKASVAIGDWYLVRWGAYDSSYRRRGDRFADLAPGAGVAADLIRSVTAGYRRKLRPDVACPAGALTLDVVARFLLEAIVEATAVVLGGRVSSVAEAAEAIRGMGGGWVVDDNARVRKMPEVSAIAAPRPVSGLSLRQAAYAGCAPLLAHAVPGLNGHRRASHLDDALDVMQPAFSFADSDTGGPAWEAVRAPLVRAWLAMTH